MRQEDSIGKHPPGGLLSKDGLLARVRNRTEQEQDCASAGTPAYAAATLGHTPYVAVGNGVIVVQRKCNWNC